MSIPVREDEAVETRNAFAFSNDHPDIFVSARRYDAAEEGAKTKPV